MGAEVYAQNCLSYEGVEMMKIIGRVLLASLLLAILQSVLHVRIEPWWKDMIYTVSILVIGSSLIGSNK